MGYIESLPGEGKLGLTLALHRKIPGALYREEHRARTKVYWPSTSMTELANSNRGELLRVVGAFDRLGLPFAVNDSTEYRIPREGETVWEGVYNLVVAVGAHDRIAEAILKLKDPLQRDILFGLPSTSHDRDYESNLVKRMWKAALRERPDLVTDELAFAPFTPTVLESDGFFELVEPELMLFREFMETVRGASETVYRETLEEFRSKVEASRTREQAPI